MANNDYNSGKATAVKFFMVLSCIASIVGGIASIARNNLTFGIILLVSLVWTVPMTISASGRLKAHEYIGTGFKICTLLFHNLIAGIILLCMNTEGEEEKQQENPANRTSPSSSQAGNPKTTSIQPNKTQSAKTPTTPVKTTIQKSSATQKAAPQNTTSTQKTTPAPNNTGASLTTSKPGVNGTVSTPPTTYTPTKKTPDNFHHWTYLENDICVKMVFYNFVYHRYQDVSGVVDDIYEYLNCAIKQSSIHMKLSNIKYLLIEEGIQNSLSVKPLSQVSDDCRRAFKRAYAKYIEDGEYIEYPLKKLSPPETNGGTTTDAGTTWPTYKIKVVLDGNTYFYRHNIHDNKDNLIKDFGFLLATELYTVESKIMAAELQKQYPTATIKIVENVSN